VSLRIHLPPPLSLSLSLSFSLSFSLRSLRKRSGGRRRYFQGEGRERTSRSAAEVTKTRDRCPDKIARDAYSWESALFAFRRVRSGGMFLCASQQPRSTAMGIGLAAGSEEIPRFEQQRAGIAAPGVASLSARRARSHARAAARSGEKLCSGTRGTEGDGKEGRERERRFKAPLPRNSSQRRSRGDNAMLELTKACAAARALPRPRAEALNERYSAISRTVLNLPLRIQRPIF